MKQILHITSGDIAGKILEKSSLRGEVFVWHDLMYDGPRNPGWPEDRTLQTRAGFIQNITGGGMSKEHIFSTLENQYHKLKMAGEYENIVLWFDACLFDQSMLVHILTCLKFLDIQKAELICVDSFPGIEPFNGLGQLTPEQLASCYNERQPVTSDQFDFAEIADKAFADQDMEAFDELSRLSNPPLPWIPAAVKRWLQEQPDTKTGLGHIEQLALDAIGDDCSTPGEIYKFVSEHDTHPQYWGDITLWAKLNALADRKPPLIQIQGPIPRLPQWEGPVDLEKFRITPGIQKQN